MKKISSKKILKSMASLNLAVFIIVSLAVLIAIGTIIESRLDAQAAAKYVYKTFWMYSLMVLLSVNLISVMVDRWPWQKRHTPFVLAHIGILILLFGGFLTMQFGLDGTMRLGIGEKSKLVTVPETELQIWSSFDGDRYTKLMSQDVDFFKNSPKDNPIQLDISFDGNAVDSAKPGSAQPAVKSENANSKFLEINDYQPYVLASRRVVVGVSPKLGIGVRFQIQNERVNLNDWLLQAKKDQSVTQNFGPAKLTVGVIPTKPTGENEIYLERLDDTQLRYAVFNRDPLKKTLKGILKEGDQFNTGWMGLQFRLLRYMPLAEEKYDFKQVERPTPMTTSVIKMVLTDIKDGQPEKKEYWLQLNDVIKVFTNNAVYLVTYGNRRVDLGFDIELKKFEVGRYQGTMRAASYQSLVRTPKGDEVLISMNEPLKYAGLTFYQASFQEDAKGQPIASVLSVNQDPGRFIKYLGSLILSLGVVWLFFAKRKAARAMAPKDL